MNHWILTRPFKTEEELYALSQARENSTRYAEIPEILEEPPDIDEETEYYDILMSKFIELEEK